MYRTHNLNELRIQNVNEEVLLSGWVSKIRNLGSFIFIDLRDRYGITQILVDNDSLIDLVKGIRVEFVIQVKGTVVERKSKNKDIPTGDIEIKATEIKVLSESQLLPFEISDDKEISESLRLKYRYLDLRRNKMKNNIIIRSKLLHLIRQFLDDNGFLDIDTPILGKSTPEGARDFLVPSRTNKNNFYALPQSPQLFKQTLMISGLDKYYQIAKCFRDEDLRKDRQLEFTQIDLEMSYIHQEDIINIVEKLVKHVMKNLKGIEYDKPFNKITYEEAMNSYGSDKPDTRFEMKLQNITHILSKTDFDVFKNAQIISAIVVENASSFSRKKIKELEEFVKTYYGIKGLAYIKYDENGVLSSSISKFLTDDILNELNNKLNLSNNKIAFVIADKKDKTLQALGALRVKLGEELGLIDDSKYNYLWVVDFPMFEWSEEENRYKAQHHPFTSIKLEDYDNLKNNNLDIIKTDSYDLVLNGYEVGGGSIRIHDSILQSIVFEKLGLSESEQKEKFGFFLETLKYGVPPHGGLAFGFDRWLMALLNEKTIKDVIPFPKTNKGQDLMIESPSLIDKKQLDELYIQVKE